MATKETSKTLAIGRDNAIRMLLDSLCDADYRAVLEHEARLEVLPIEWTVRGFFNTNTNTWQTLIEV